MSQTDNRRALRVLQITDPHLMADPAGALLGVNTRESLDAVIGEVLRCHPEPDLVLATGDLAQDGSAAAYQVFRDKLACLPCRSLWIPGNHDDRTVMAGVVAGSDVACRHVVLGGWQFLMLDSSVPGKVHGELADAELDFLADTLARNPGLPAMVVLHHHPVDVSARWMAEIGLRNRDAFWHIIDRFPQVRVVLWGHVHQELDRVRNGVRLLASPSTCIQFAPDSDGFAVEALPPGYRWFELYPGGTFDTGIRRADSFTFRLDHNSTGY